MVRKTENELKEIAKHVKILNEEVGNLKINIEKLRTDIKWIMRIMIGIFVAVIVNTIL